MDNGAKIQVTAVSTPITAMVFTDIFFGVALTAGSNGRRGKRFRKCYVYVFGRYASAFYAALPVDEIIGIKERPRGQKKRAGT